MPVSPVLRGPARLWAEQAVSAVPVQPASPAPDPVLCARTDYLPVSDRGSPSLPVPDAPFLRRCPVFHPYPSASSCNRALPSVRSPTYSQRHRRWTHRVCGVPSREPLHFAVWFSAAAVLSVPFRRGHPHPPHYPVLPQTACARYSIHTHQRHKAEPGQPGQWE